MTNKHSFLCNPCSEKIDKMNENNEHIMSNAHLKRVICKHCFQRIEFLFPDIVESEEEGDDCYDSEEVAADEEQDRYDDDDDLDYDPSVEAY